MQSGHPMRYLWNMRKRRFLICFATVTLSHFLFARTAPECPVQPATIRAMQDCYRPVLVFAPSAKDADFTAQQALLEQYADDMMDRNLLYVPVLARGGQFKAPLDAPYIVLGAPEQSALRTRFQVAPNEFVVLLVGKDGGEKFRSKKPVSVLRLDQLVDAMPMGSQEKAARTAKSH
jgi:hypothetical protein